MPLRDVEPGRCEGRVSMKSNVAVSQYIEDCSLRNLAPKTIAGYRWALNRFVRWGEDLPSTSLECQRVVAVRGMADDSLHDLWRASKTFYRWLERVHGEENLMANVAPPRVRRRFPRSLGDDEVKELFNVADSLRDLTVLAFLLDTGARIGEVSSLRASDISRDGVNLFGKTGPRFVPLSREVFELTEKIKDGTNVWMGRWGPLTVHGMSQLVRRMMNQAGLNPPKVGPHTLRHTFAMRFLRNGGNLAVLQRLLGHKDIQSTMIYANMADHDLVVQHKQCGPLKGVSVEGLAARL